MQIYSIKSWIHLQTITIAKKTAVIFISFFFTKTPPQESVTKNVHTKMVQYYLYSIILP